MATVNSIKEEWRTVSILPPDVEVSSLGNVRRYINMTETVPVNIMKSQEYPTVSIRGKTYQVHRLVALAFIPDSDKKSTAVNHKNGNKWDNRVENLEWVSVSSNTKKSFINNKKKIYCKELDTIYGSMRTAAYLTSVPQDIIARGIQENKSVCGFTFNIIEAPNPLLADHSIMYVDFDSMFDICTQAKSVDDTKDSLKSHAGDGYFAQS